jgi:hypothetical protein
MLASFSDQLDFCDLEVERHGERAVEELHPHDSLHILILLAALLILADVAPAASASFVRSPSFLNDASHNAAAF